MVAPPCEVACTYESKTSPMHRKQERLVKESRTLAALRDTLLPKLLSGEVRVPEAERVVGEHIANS